MTAMLSKKKLIKLLKQPETRLVAVKSAVTEDYHDANTFSAFGLKVNSEVEVRITLIVPQTDEGDDE